MKSLILGSAQWGWNMDAKQVFQLLDAWLDAGEKRIDTATNYPIDRNPAHFQAAEQLLVEYIRAHGLKDLQVNVKIGSLDNMRSTEVNLSPSFILMMTEEYLRQLDGNLDCVMFHWDNRSNEQEIQASLEALQNMVDQFGIRPGLSGIAHPETYAAIGAALRMNFDIQLKHNVIHSDWAKYQALQQGGHSFFAYGLNAGGMKLDADYAPDSTLLVRGGDPAKMEARRAEILAQLPVWNTASVRPPIKTMNQIGLIYALHHPGFSGAVIGPSTIAQLQQSLECYRDLSVFDYADVFKGLSSLTTT